MRTITAGEHNSHDNGLSVSELTELLNNRDLPNTFPTYSNLGESPTEKIVTDFGGSPTYVNSNLSERALYGFVDIQ